MWNLFAPLIEKFRDFIRPSRATYLTAAALGAYVLLGWAWTFLPSALTGPVSSTCVLLLAPLLFFSLVDFREGETLARVGGLVWLPFYLVIVAVAKAAGGLLKLFTKHGGKIVKGDQWLRDALSSGEGEPDGAPTEQSMSLVAETGKTSADADALATDAGLAGVEETFRSIRPRGVVQAVAYLTWGAWLFLWVAPVFLDLSIAGAWVRGLVGLLFPLLFLGVLLGIEFSYRPFPFWRTTVGLLWTPGNAALRLAFRTLFLRPRWVQALLRRVWVLRKLYYPATLFVLFNRRYLTFLLSVAVACLLVVVTSTGYVVAIALCLGLYVVEATRLIGQLREVRYLGVADFDDVSEVIDAQEEKAAAADKVEEGKELAEALLRYMHVRLARKVLDEAQGDDSYFGTVLAILVKHIGMMGLALTALRVLYVCGFRQNTKQYTDLDIVDTLINSFILLFGEVTFVDGARFLSLVSLLGVAASFLLLGLGLTYLSGTAHENYKRKAEALEASVVAFEASPEMEAVREGLLAERAGKLSDIGPWDMYAIYTRWSR